MKNLIIILLVAVLCLSVCSCNGSNENEPAVTTTTTVVDPPAAIDLLNDEELLLFDFLIELTSNDFFEPSAVRVLEVGDYEERSHFKGTSYEDVLYGPDTIVVRLQGENLAGGTANNHYVIALNTAENTTSYGKNQTKFDYPLTVIYYKAEAGQYVQLGESYSIEEPAENYNVGNINRAIAEYWSEMGF